MAEVAAQRGRARGVVCAGRPSDAGAGRDDQLGDRASPRTGRTRRASTRAAGWAGVPHRTISTATGPDGGLHLSRTQNPAPSTEDEWDLNALTDESILHELLHVIGLDDEYPQSNTLFRKNERSAGVHAHEIMASLATDLTAVFPQRHLVRIETVSDSNAVIHSLPLQQPDPRPARAPGVPGVPSLDANGEVIPAEQRACVEVTVVGLGPRPVAWA